ncbi:hypothetical protein VTK26DRAFT_453 [Humicola hyalothermophila]
MASCLLEVAKPQPPSTASGMSSNMCWLCGRETEILRYNHVVGRQPTLFRVITFSRAIAEVESYARISPVVAGAKQPIPRGFGKSRRKSVPSSLDSSGHPHVFDEPFNQATQTWTFRVHADCWDLVACRVSNPIALATTWCKALISLNRNANPSSPTLDPHDSPTLLLPGAKPSGKKNYRRLSLSRLESFDGLAAELGLERLPTVHHPVPLADLSLPPSSRLGGHRPQQAVNDVFAALPTEILQQILRSAFTRDLLNLRFASRAVARASHLEALPRSFWFSRFTPPFEMGFALPERSGPDLDWRALYFLIRRALLRREEGTLPPLPGSRAGSCLARLAKRGYWWERLSGVYELYSVWGAGRMLEGAPMPKAPFNTPERGAGTGRYCSAVCLPIDMRPGVVAAVGVSSVEVAGRRFVCGLRVLYGGLEPPGRIGYVLSQRETIELLSPGESFRGIELRRDSGQVSAVRVIVTKPSGRARYGEWVGDVDAPHPRPDVATSCTQTVVLATSNATSCYLIASFDYFRMLAIELTEGNIASTDVILHQTAGSEQTTREIVAFGKSTGGQQWSVFGNGLFGLRGRFPLPLVHCSPNELASRSLFR